MGKIDELDSLKVTVLTEDSAGYASPCLAQHGLSILLEARRGGTIKRILVDVGQSPEVLISNMASMGISPSIVDAIVLTHCHYDHARGIVRVLREIGRRDVQVIAHPDIFRIHFATEPYYRYIGIMGGDYKVDIEKTGVELCLTKDPFVIMPGVVTTGEVKRQTDFEEVSTKFKTIKDEMVVNDMMLDDISVIANIRGKGLVIISGCSHAGIVNIIRQAIAVTGCDKVEGILGGMHLIDAEDTRIERTVEELLGLEMAWVKTGHCTGFKAQVALYLAFGERFSPLHTDMQFELG